MKTMGKTEARPRTKVGWLIVVSAVSFLTVFFVFFRSTCVWPLLGVPETKVAGKEKICAVVGKDKNGKGGAESDKADKDSQTKDSFETKKASLRRYAESKDPYKMVCLRFCLCSFLFLWIFLWLSC